METNERQIMSTPHKATPGEWKKVRNWINNDAVASVLLEVADRVVALEAVLASHGEQISGLHSQHNLVVDSITDLQGCVNQLEAVTSPPFAADHSRGATEMVATDEELIETFYVGARGALATPGFRAIYNLGRQHSAQSRQEDQPLPLPAPVTTNQAAIDRFGEWLAREMLPGTRGAHLHWAPRIVFAVLNACQEVEPTPPPAPDDIGASQPRQEVEPTPPPTPAGDLPSPRTVAAGLLEECSQHEQGGPMRELLSTSAFLLDRYASDLDSRPQPTPPPAPAGGLVEMVAEEIYDFTGDHVDDNEASAVIRAVADWLQQRSSTIANGSQWAETLRKETDRSSAAPPRPVPPPPAPAGGLLEDVARLLTNRISLMLPGADCKYLARDAFVVVADWLDARGDRGSAAALRREADR
jgi:hypothetical protein